MNDWIESVPLIEKSWGHLRKSEKCGARRRNTEVKICIAGEKRNQSQTNRSQHWPKSIGEITRDGTEQIFPERKLPWSIGMRNTGNSVFFGSVPEIRMIPESTQNHPKCSIMNHPAVFLSRRQEEIPWWPWSEARRAQNRQTADG